MTTALEKHTKILHSDISPMHPFAGNQQAQRLFMDGLAGDTSAGLKMMIDGLELYCQGYRKESFNEDGNAVGTDYVFGPQVEAIAHALTQLLSGPGKFDGGTVSAAITEIAAGPEPTLSRLRRPNKVETY